MERKTLESIFNAQMERLKSIDIPMDLIEVYRKQKDNVIEHSLNNVGFLKKSLSEGQAKDLFGRKIIPTNPFFPVIPLERLREIFINPLLPLNLEELKLLSFSNLEDSVEFSFFKENHDVILGGAEPYFVFGWEDGKHQNSAPKGLIEAKRYFGPTAYRPMNLSEMISFMIFYPSLYQGENIVSLESEYLYEENTHPRLIRSRKGFKLGVVSEEKTENNVFPSYLDRRRFA